MPDPDQAQTEPQAAPSAKKSSPKWLTLAIASGAFAAFNGVFAKLTTTSKTHNFAASISHLFGLSENNRFIELLLRAAFFGLNLLSNAIMWILFTRALTASTSSTRVAVLNTSANFLVTAVLGMVIFAEALPLGWWAGAALLVSGSVIIGAREGAEQKADGAGTEQEDAGGIALGEGGPGVGGGVGVSVIREGGFNDEDEQGSQTTGDSYRDNESTVDEDTREGDFVDDPLR